MSSNASMSPDELARLTELLDRYAHSEDGLTLEALDGFLSAVIVGPGAMIMPSEYLPEIWAGEPDFASEDDAREAMMLIMRLNNHIAQRLTRDPDSDEPADHPLVLVPADENGEPLEELPADFPLGAVWASGFLRAAGLRLDDWQHWLGQHPELAADFDAIMNLSLVDAEQLAALDIDEEPFSLAERQEIVDDLSAILAGMNTQRLHDRRPQPARRASSAGRNDTCPCGSGRKYKRCCGDPARLN